MKKLFTLLAVISVFTASAQFKFDIAGATGTYVTGINDSGYICGYFTSAAGTSGFFFNGHDTTIINATQLTGATYVVCSAVNNLGYVIGYWNTGNATNNLPFRYNWKQRSIGNTYTVQTSGYTNIRVNDIDDNLTISGDCWGAAADRRFFSESTSGITFTEHYVGSSTYPTYGGGGHKGTLTTGYFISGVEKYGFVFDFSNSTYTFDNLLHQGLHKSIPGGMNSHGHYVIEVGGGTNAYICTDYTNAANNLLPVSVPAGATAIHPLHLNNSDYVCGWYKDALGHDHGFFENIYDIGFRPRFTGGDGWTFQNTVTTMYPPSEYPASYNSDPYNPNAVWPAHRPSIPLSAYPSWPMFVKTFGTGYCYQTDANGVVSPIPLALNMWFAMTTHTIGWEGACFGMTGNAIVRFDNKSIFEAYTPALVSTGALSAYLPTHEAILACNSVQLATDKSVEFKNQRASYMGDVTSNLARLENLLSDTVRGSHHPVIAMNVTPIGTNPNLRAGAHAVVPFRIEKDTVNKNGDIWISIYDPNQPGDENRKIILHQTPGSSSYDWNYQIFDVPVTVWGGNNANFSGFFQVLDPYPAFQGNLTPLKPVTISSNANEHGSRSTGQINVTFSDSTGHQIVDGAGDTTGFYNGVFKNNIPGAYAFWPLGGAADFVNDYALNAGNTYTTDLKTNTAGPVSAWMQLDSVNLLGFTLDTSLLNDLNKAVFTDGLMYLNPTAGTRKVSMRAVVAKDYYYSLISVPMTQNSSLKITPINVNELKVDNTGPATHYNLDITASPGGHISNFHFDSIPFTANTTHIIKLVSDSVSTSGIWVFVDTLQNGTVEDTLFLQNQLSPLLALSKHIDTLSTISNVDTFAIANFGGGTLTWNVVSMPSWIAVASGSTGTQEGKVVFNYSANTVSPRSGYIVVAATGATHSPDSVFVYQDVSITTPINSTDEEGNSITIYPNPTSGILNVDLSSQKQLNTIIEIFDLNGKEILKSKITDIHAQIDIQNLATGCYLLRIISERTVAVKKLVKD